jgi:hypothetical protein
MGGHGFSPRFCSEASVLGCVLLSTRDWRKAAVKRGEEAMEILEAYDVTGSLRGAAALAGCEGFYVKSGNGPGKEPTRDPKGLRGRNSGRGNAGVAG